MGGGIIRASISTSLLMISRRLTSGPRLLAVRSWKAVSRKCRGENACSGHETHSATRLASSMRTRCSRALRTEIRRGSPHTNLSRQKSEEFAPGGAVVGLVTEIDRWRSLPFWPVDFWYRLSDRQGFDSGKLIPGAVDVGFVNMACALGWYAPAEMLMSGRPAKWATIRSAASANVEDSC